MRIVHLSYARIPDHNDPEEWLNRLPFYTTMVEKTAEYAEVMSVHCINYEGTMKRNGVDYHFVKTKRHEIQFPLLLHRHLRSLHPDIIIVHGLIFAWQVIWLRAQLGKFVKLVLVHHSERPLRFHKQFFQKMADRFVHAYFFTSQSMAQTWVDSGQIRDISKTHEVMIGSSIFYPFDRELSKEKTQVKGQRTYLWVGHLDHNKDPFTLIKAFQLFVKDYPDGKLYVIYQKNDLRDRVTALINNCEQIVLVGKVDHKDLLYWFNSVDFIISTSHYEGGGIAVCEAMSCGCIPILTCIPSFMMMTSQGKLGLHFKPNDVQGLYDALAKSTMLDLSRARREVLENFQTTLSNEAIVRKMMVVFQSLISVK